MEWVKVQGTVAWQKYLVNEGLGWEEPAQMGR